MAPSSPRTAQLGIADLDERQLRQLSDANAAWRNWAQARREAQQVRGSMRWRTVKGRRYLVRVAPSGAEKSLGLADAAKESMHADFHARKARAQARLKAMQALLAEQKKLNRVYQVGRCPLVVVRALAALDEAGLGDDFLTVGTHAMFAYEGAAGVRVSADATATRDLDLLFDMNRWRTFSARLERADARSLLDVLRRADGSFAVRSDQLQTAANDAGFEVDVIRRVAVESDPHPLRMSDDENDFWAVQVSQGQALGSARRFEAVVIAATGDMAMMRTLHPLDFVRMKTQLARRAGRDPLKSPKDALQSRVVKLLWDNSLRHLVSN